MYLQSILTITHDNPDKEFAVCDIRTVLTSVYEYSSKDIKKCINSGAHSRESIQKYYESLTDEKKNTDDDIDIIYNWPKCFLSESYFLLSFVYMF